MPLSRSLKLLAPLLLLGATAVTLTTTAVTPEAGTGPNPSMVITRVASCVMGPLPAPVLLSLHWFAGTDPLGRVSQTRYGVTGV